MWLSVSVFFFSFQLFSYFVWLSRILSSVVGNEKVGRYPRYKERQVGRQVGSRYLLKLSVTFLGDFCCFLVSQQTKLPRGALPSVRFAEMTISWSLFDKRVPHLADHHHRRHHQGKGHLSPFRGCMLRRPTNTAVDDSDSDLRRSDG